MGILKGDLMANLISPKPVEDELKARLKELVKRLVETGNALEAQAYDAWRKDGMLDFPAAAVWTKLVETLEPPKVEK